MLCVTFYKHIIQLTSSNNVFFNQTPSKKKIEMSTIGSAYHLEINPRYCNVFLLNKAISYFTKH